MSVIGSAAVEEEPAALRDRLPSGPYPPAELRGCFGMFATGITVITAGGANPCGMTANSFTSVSLDPPLVLVCIVHDAAMHKAILSEGTFAISVLAAHQEPVARHFANRGRPRGEREFETVRWRPGAVTGAPVVADTLAWIECGLAAVYDGGDHSIFVGSVLDMGKGGAGDALLFFGGGYHRLEPGA
ncbi:flavin reductase (DIM6/NTAB) family NADH-FMN oxidoreductase RutF [Catenulispora sp. MAP5-51]